MMLDLKNKKVNNGLDPLHYTHLLRGFREWC